MEKRIVETVFPLYTVNFNKIFVANLNLQTEKAALRKIEDKKIEKYASMYAFIIQQRIF